MFRRYCEANKKAFKNLVKHYKETHDESIFDEDIFKVLDKIIDMAIFNPPPINTKHSMSNVSELGVYLMNSKNIYKQDKYEHLTSEVIFKIALMKISLVM